MYFNFFSIISPWWFFIWTFEFPLSKNAFCQGRLKFACSEEDESVKNLRTTGYQKSSQAFITGEQKNRLLVCECQKIVRL